MPNKHGANNNQLLEVQPISPLPPWGHYCPEKIPTHK